MSAGHGAPQPTAVSRYVAAYPRARSRGSPHVGENVCEVCARVRTQQLITPSSVCPSGRILHGIHSSLTVLFPYRWSGTPQPRAVQPLATVILRLVSVCTQLSEDDRDRSWLSRTDRLPRAILCERVTNALVACAASSPRILDPFVRLLPRGNRYRW